MPPRSARQGVRSLVLGGIRSGKSAYAEGLFADTPGMVRYLATGAAPERDDTWAARVEAHRRRRPQHWVTAESTDVAGQLRSEPCPTLVDDIGGWLTAMMDRRAAWTGGSVDADINDLCAAVADNAGPLVLVSPEVGLTVVSATPAGRLFTDELGTLNQRLAALCDRVVLVVAGQPLVVKGEP